MQTLLNDYVAESQQDDYSRLPDAIRDVYSRKEYLWLSDEQKARLVQTETEPDVYED